MNTNNKKILFLSPHPDDHIMCAGLIMDLCNKGWTAEEILFTDGSRKGDVSTKLRRFKEHNKACKYLGISKIYRLNYINDTNWEDEFDHGNLVKIIQDSSPSIVIMPSPTDYHPEHQLVSKIGIRAVRVSNYDLMGKNKVRIPMVLYTLGLLPSKPDFLFEIDKYYSRKLNLIKIYEKEITPRLKQWIESESNYMGYFSRTDRAEGFLLPNEWPANLTKLLN